MALFLVTEDLMVYFLCLLKEVSAYPKTKEV
jgi:hypothetical protein